MNRSYTVTYNSIYNFFWGGPPLWPSFWWWNSLSPHGVFERFTDQRCFWLSIPITSSGSWKNLMLFDFHARFDVRILIRTRKVHEMMTNPYGDNMGRSNKPNFNKMRMRNTVILSATVQYQYFFNFLSKSLNMRLQPTVYIRVSFKNYAIQGGPLLVVCRVITPKKRPYKWLTGDM